MHSMQNSMLDIAQRLRVCTARRAQGRCVLMVAHSHCGSNVMIMIQIMGQPLRVETRYTKARQKHREHE